MPIEDYNYSEIEPTGLANPENMFLVVGIIIVIGFILFAVWAIYNWLS